ncbi:MAG: translation initiation factor [Myxococcales bacterium]|nr:translation initiation factor [Myxococcales bacterium]
MKRKHQRESLEPAEAPRNDAFAALAGLQAPPRRGLEPGGAIASGAAAESPGAEPAIALDAKLIVRRETKGRKGKTVTRILGLPAPHRERLAQRLRRALGCGATLEGEDLVLLGSLVDRAAAWLEAEGARHVIRGN